MACGSEDRPPLISQQAGVNPSPESIRPERWVGAEAATRDIISKVQPTAVSEERRRGVIDYVHRLIRGYLRCEVVPYGSVPLKTYLPDGDIDLTAFGGASLEDALANDVVSVLQAEEQNSSAEFVVKDVQLIRAEVKLVKCIVQNIVVDISFNQLGGLCTLCFLEKVDRQIGKDHLFKRSIILIKAWCYYESRILGAHHALISTYALETLVLYIFHLFHSSLDGPLAVLYRFLDYFSKFDWDEYCISLNGPVRISSLPDIVDKKIENGETDLLLSDEFLRQCVDMFSVPSRGFDKNSRTFPPKHLNIIDPLKRNNNLGRSVSKGNLFRIRSAFAYGARKLRQTLLEEENNIADELSKFFSNTLDRHGSGQRPDVQDLCGGCRASISAAANSVSTNGVVCKGSSGNNDDGSSSIVSGGERGCHRDVVTAGTSSRKGSSREVVNPKMISKDGGKIVNGSSADVWCTSSVRKEDLASSKLLSLDIANDSPKGLPPQQEDNGGILHFAPHLYFSGPNSRISCASWEENNVPIVASSEQVSTTAGGIGEEMASCYEHASVFDLSGNLDTHFNNLQYGRSCYEHHSLGLPPAVVAAAPPPLPSQWDVVRHSYGPYKQQNGFCNNNNNVRGMIPRPPPGGFHPNHNAGVGLIPHPATTSSFGIDDLPKQRGTGTYIPNVHRPPYRNHFMGRGMNEQHGAAVSRSHHPRYASLDPFRKIDTSIINGLNLPNQHGKGVAVPVHVHWESSKSNSTRHQNPASSQNLLQPVTEGLPSPKPVMAAADKDMRLVMANSLYRLKDEDEFPPLSM